MCILCQTRQLGERSPGEAGFTAQACENAPPARGLGAVVEGPAPQVMNGFGSVTESGDFAASTATTAFLQIGQTAYGRIANTTDSDWLRIELVQGQSYEFRLHGMGFNGLTDPLLRLRDSTGVVVSSNDDAGSATWGGTNGPTRGSSSSRTPAEPTSWRWMRSATRPAITS
jgi:hypothetical protein